MRSAAATAAVSSLNTSFSDGAADDGDDGGSGRRGRSDSAVHGACAVGRKYSTRLRQRRTTTPAAENAVVAPLVVAAAAAVDEARASDGLPGGNIFSERIPGHSVTTRPAGHRENDVGNGKGEVCVSLEKEEKGDGAGANTMKTDRTVGDDADADKPRDTIVEKASEVVGADGSLLQERFRDAGFVRREVGDPRRSRDPQSKAKAPLDARKLKNRELVQEKNNEPAKVVEGGAPVPVLNHSRRASRGQEEGVEEGENDHVREDDTETNDYKKEEEKAEEDQGDNEDKRGKDGDEEDKKEMEEYKEQSGGVG